MDYQIIENDDYYNVFWCENDYGEALLYTKTFNEEGHALNDRVFELGSHDKMTYYNGNHIEGFPEAIKLSNGNTVVCIRSIDGTGLSHIDVNVFDEQGTLISRYKFDAMSMKVEALDRGKFAIFWSSYNAVCTKNIDILDYAEEMAENGLINLNMQIIDASGRLEGGIIEVNDGRVQDRCASFEMIMEISNGSHVIIWQEDGYFYDDALRMRIMDAEGLFISEDFILTSGRWTLSSETKLYDVRELKDGNIMVIWQDRNTMFERGFGLRMRIFGHNGEPEGNEVALHEYDTWTMKDDTLKKIVYANDGHILYFIEDHTDLYDGDICKVINYDLKKHEISSCQLLYSEQEQSVQWGEFLDAIYLGNGDLAVFWRESDIDKGVCLKMRRYDSDMNIKGGIYTFGR